MTTKVTAKDVLNLFERLRPLCEEAAGRADAPEVVAELVWLHLQAWRFWAMACGQPPEELWTSAATTLTGINARWEREHPADPEEDR